MKEKLAAFERLLNIMDELREKCPWDKEQTFESLRTLTIEETYELSDSITQKDLKGIRKELGDVLLHIIFYSKIGSETQDFDIKDVIDSLCEKLIYRHPHIFGETKVKNSAEVSQNWEQLKLKEKDGNKSVLSGIPSSLPALIKAMRIQEKARGVGFDWEDREDVWGKVHEEIDELKEELDGGNPDRIEDEYGDVLFVLVNLGRLYNVNPENALERANRKFTSRFNYIESQTIEQGKSIKDVSLKEMDRLWNEAKQLERK